MREWWAEWYNKYAVVVLCTVIGYAGYHSICWSHVDGQTWAGWVQAIGSIAALAGVAWTVLTQEKFRRRDAIDRGTVIAATMPLLVDAVFNAVLRLHMEMTTVETQDCYPEYFSEALERLEAVRMWTPDDLAGLAPLPNGFALKMARAIDKLNATIVQLRTITKLPSIRNDPIVRKARAGELAIFLNETSQLFDIVANDMRLASQNKPSSH